MSLPSTHVASAHAAPQVRASSPDSVSVFYTHFLMPTATRVMGVEKASPQPPRGLYMAVPTLPGSLLCLGSVHLLLTLSLPWRAPRPHSFWFWLCLFLLEDAPAFALEL